MRLVKRYVLLLVNFPVASQFDCGIKEKIPGGNRLKHVKGKVNRPSFILEIHILQATSAGFSGRCLNSLREFPFVHEDDCSGEGRGNCAGD